MELVVISADDYGILCSVPKNVAKKLSYYCKMFSRHWFECKAVKKHVVYLNGEKKYACDYHDFVEYINYMFPDKKSVCIKDLNETTADAYSDLPSYNF